VCSPPRTQVFVRGGSRIVTEVNDARSFFNLYRHNFVRTAVAIPQVLVADPSFNANQTIDLMREATKRRALMVLFPELGLSAYSCEDPFHQQPLLEASRGIKTGGMHALRHGRVSHMQSNMMPGDFVTNQIGHSDLRVTSNYTHFEHKQKREMVERLSCTQSEARYTVADHAKAS
jgi:hypothetical protein